MCSKPYSFLLDSLMLLDLLLIPLFWVALPKSQRSETRHCLWIDGRLDYSQEPSKFWRTPAKYHRLNGCTLSKLLVATHGAGHALSFGEPREVPVTAPGKRPKLKEALRGQKFTVIKTQSWKRNHRLGSKNSNTESFSLKSHSRSTVKISRMVIDKLDRYSRKSDPLTEFWLLQSDRTLTTP